MASNMGAGKMKKMIDDVKEEEYLPRFIIKPEAPFRFWWDFVCFLCLVFLLAVIPYGVAFTIDKSRSDQAKEDDFKQALVVALFTLADVFFVVDMILRSSCFAYYEINVETATTKLVAQRKTIFQHYVYNRWFLVDIVAFIPWEVLFLPGVGGKAATYFRVARMLRARHLGYYFSRITHFVEVKLKANGKLVHMVQQMLLLLLVIYMLAIVWICIAWTGGSDSQLLNWIERDSLVADYSDRETMILMRAIYYVMSTLTTMGTGDIIPASNAEIVFSMAVMLLGMFIVPTIVGLLMSAVQNLDAVRSGNSLFASFFAFSSPLVDVSCPHSHCPVASFSCSIFVLFV